MLKREKNPIEAKEAKKNPEKCRDHVESDFSN